jgi:hypothetical protein
MVVEPSTPELALSFSKPAKETTAVEKEENNPVTSPDIIGIDIIIFKQLFSSMSHIKQPDLSYYDHFSTTYSARRWK